MMAGKTSHLIADLITYHDLDKKVLFVNHIKDTRDKDYSTHRSGKPELPSTMTKMKIDLLAKISNPEQFFAIGVDESQWFMDLVPVITSWLERGIWVFCSGLNGSFEQKPFGKILDLVPQADEVVHLKAKCTTCLFDGTIKDAPFTKRLIEDRTLNIPGGKETYAAVCRKHLPIGSTLSSKCRKSARSKAVKNMRTRSRTIKT